MKTLIICLFFSFFISCSEKHSNKISLNLNDYNKTFYENGNLKERYYFTDNILNGVDSFDYSGKLLQENRYYNDTFELKQYYNNSSLKKHSIYFKKEMLYSTSLKPDGEILSEKRMIHIESDSDNYFINDTINIFASIYSFNKCTQVEGGLFKELEKPILLVKNNFNYNTDRDRWEFRLLAKEEGDYSFVVRFYLNQSESEKEFVQDVISFKILNQ